jgi:hypothetical protein
MACNFNWLGEVGRFPGVRTTDLAIPLGISKLLENLRNLDSPKYKGLY